MKTKYWIALLALLLIGCAGASLFLLRPTQAAQAEIISQGQVVCTVDLSEDQVLTIPAPDGGYNVVTVSGGKIAVTEATCPDHYCMARGYCSGGAQIVCLPNSLVIRFLGEQAVDGAVG